jgi:hypothetical protein
MKLKSICSLVAIMLAVIPPCASAQDEQELKKTVVLDNIRTTATRQRPQSANTTDHRLTPESALQQVAFAMQWMIGANRKSNVDGILTRGVNPKTSPQSFYNLKNLHRKRFLGYERQGTAGGMNIGWTDDASSNTAERFSAWGIFPKDGDPRRPGSGNPAANSNGLRKSPVVYGEIVAIGWWPPQSGTIAYRYSEFSQADGAHVPRFLTYKRRNVGPNMEWSSYGASYEWVILGGEPGTPVRRGEDKVILFNLRVKKPLLFIGRQSGANVGFFGEPGIVGKVVPRDYKDIEPPVWSRLMLKPAQDAIR